MLASRFLSLALAASMLVPIIPALAQGDDANTNGLLSTLTGHQSVLIDSEYLREKASHNEPAKINVGGKEVTVHLEYNSMRAGDFRAGTFDANGTFNQIFLPRVNTFKGKVLDDNLLPIETSEVRLTIDLGKVTGYIREGEVTYNIQPADKDTSVNPAPHITYTNDQVAPWGALKFVEDAPNQKAQTASPEALAAVATSTAIVRIVLVADPLFVSDQGSASTAFSTMESIFNEVEGVYNTVASYDFQFVMDTTITDSQLGGCWDANTMTTGVNNFLNTLYKNGQVADFHMAHLFSGRDIRGPGSCDAGGSLYGYGDGTLGDVKMTSMTQMRQEDAYIPNQNNAHRRWVTAHESGHISGGQHCDADYYLAGGPFTVEFRKSTMAPWATLGQARTGPCSDVPSDYAIYGYNYNDRFSSGAIDSSNNNKGHFDDAAALALPAASTPSAPTGPSSGTTHAVITLNFNAPCNAYFEIDWADGTTTGRPTIGDTRCGSFTFDKVYLEAANYAVKWRVKLNYHSTWSDWSPTFQIAISCFANDIGPNCDAPNTWSGATPVTSSPITGWILPGDPTDFYKFTVVSGAHITAHLTVPCVDYDLYLWDPAGSNVRNSLNFNCAAEDVDLPSSTSGDYRLEVRSFQGASSGSSYQLSYTVVAPNQPPTVQITSPSNGATVSGASVSIQGTASDSDGTVQLVEVQIDNGAWQSASGTTSWQRTWDSTSSANGGHTIRARSWDGTANSNPASISVTVSNGGGGGTIAQNAPIISSTGEFGNTGTLITFNGVSGGSPIQVTYKYCYLANSNGRAGDIRTVFDGTTVDDLSFTQPYTGGATCDGANSATFATRTFSVSSAVSSSIRFDFTNGDWRVAIAAITVTGGGSTSALNENFESGANGWTSTGLWHLTIRRSVSPTHASWYGKEDTLNFDTGVANSGSLTSPTFTVPSTTPQLKFQSWYSTEDTSTSWDTKTVKITTNGGSTWTQVGQVSGTNQAWILQTISLASYAGQSVKIRFDFDTVDSVNNAFEGWFVDDVQVTST